MTEPSETSRAALQALERQLGIGLIVQDVEPGPPVHIVAIGMLDGATTELTGSGATEDDAWADLARAAIAWKNDDERNARMFFGMNGVRAAGHSGTADEGRPPAQARGRTDEPSGPSTTAQPAEPISSRSASAFA